MKITKTLPDETATRALAAQLASVIKEGAIIFLHGSLGAGKTTFTRGFLAGLGYHDKVKSPTYTLVEPYNIAGRMIFHFDFYRLKSADELEYIGIKDYFSSSSICLIEWPDKGFPYLPLPDLDCYIEFAGNERVIKMESRSSKGEVILQQL